MINYDIAVEITKFFEKRKVTRVYSVDIETALELWKFYKPKDFSGYYIHANSISTFEKTFYSKLKDLINLRTTCISFYEAIPFTFVLENCGCDFRRSAGSSILSKNVKLIDGTSYMYPQYHTHDLYINEIRKEVHKRMRKFCRIPYFVINDYNHLSELNKRLIYYEKFRKNLIEMTSIDMEIISYNQDDSLIMTRDMNIPGFAYIHDDSLIMTRRMSYMSIPSRGYNAYIYREACLADHNRRHIKQSMIEVTKEKYANTLCHGFTKNHVNKLKQKVQNKLSIPKYTKKNIPRRNIKKYRH